MSWAGWKLFSELQPLPEAFERAGRRRETHGRCPDCGSVPGPSPVCGLCGLRLETGDPFRGVMANVTGSPVSGNFYVCENCDGTDHALLAKRAELQAQADHLFAAGVRGRNA